MKSVDLTSCPRHLFWKEVVNLSQQKRRSETGIHRTAQGSADAHKRREVEVEGGVAISPVPLTLGERVTVKYNGLLAQAGAREVYLHRGYGHSHNWKSVSDLPMKKSDEAWEAQFEADDESRLNFCFKDHTGNWDNNNGGNWSLEIHTGEVP